MKPHKGVLTNWYPVYSHQPTEEHLGFYIMGVFHGHPRFHGKSGHTSMVVAVHAEINEVETLNSRYSLEKPAIPEITIHNLYP